MAKKLRQPDRVKGAKAVANLRSGPRTLDVSNPNKVLYAAARFRKIEVVAYYTPVAPFLLPHFRNRPVTLKRDPDVHGEAFYEKDAPS